MKKLLRDPTPRNFMEVSGEFSEKLGLIEDDLHLLIESAKRAGAIGASQVMLGQAMFALVKRKDVTRVKRALLEIAKPGEILTTGISRNGARLF
jgi:pantoate kinase